MCVCVCVCVCVCIGGSGYVVRSEELYLCASLLVAHTHTHTPSRHECCCPSVRRHVSFKGSTHLCDHQCELSGLFE